jgi:AcrR family transcriptional regulator
MAAQMGLEGLSIGALAEATGMSKSGVFAHFGSREDLQISVVREYHARFEREVFAPAVAAPRGLPRLRALFDHWMRYTSRRARLGRLHLHQRRGGVRRPSRPRARRPGRTRCAWHGAMKRADGPGQGRGPPERPGRRGADAFETHGLILALHYEARFLRQPGAIERAGAASTTCWRATARAADPISPSPLCSTFTSFQE